MKQPATISELTDVTLAAASRHNCAELFSKTLRITLFLQALAWQPILSSPSAAQIKMNEKQLGPISDKTDLAGVPARCRK